MHKDNEKLKAMLKWEKHPKMGELGFFLFKKKPFSTQQIQAQYNKK